MRGTDIVTADVGIQRLRWRVHGSGTVARNGAKITRAFGTSGDLSHKLLLARLGVVIDGLVNEIRRHIAERGFLCATAAAAAAAATAAGISSCTVRKRQHRNEQLGIKRLQQTD
jgi:hypothetical protein